MHGEPITSPFQPFDPSAKSQPRTQFFAKRTSALIIMTRLYSVSCYATCTRTECCMVALSKEAAKNSYTDAHKETSMHGLYLVC